MRQTTDATQSILQRMKRKQLVLPTEHGSWAWFFVPFSVGALVGGKLSLPVWLTLVGGLSLFLMRTPATVLYRIQRKRARKADRAPAMAWIGVLTAVAVVALIGLLILGRAVLLWLLLPLTAVFTLYLIASRRGRAGLRSLGMEVAGATALAGMAPAALVAAEGQFLATAWWLWLLTGLVNIMGAIYVRIRIADTHQRPTNRSLFLWANLFVLVNIIILVVLQMLPWGTALPFVFFVARAVWAIQKPRPVANVRNFGFVEIGVELTSGVLIALMFIGAV
ncbi:MAG: YwiC-like family protein [Chloroflexi bacterium]|nr:YwiC-like family protein [Chloroflexota bacterium]